MKGVSAVILAGGRARRFGGRDKSRLRLGGRTFLERLQEALAGFDELFLSVGSEGAEEVPGLTLVPDIHPDHGAAGGILSALRASRSPWLLAVGCDLPLFERGLAEYLAEFISSDYQALILKDRSGRVHPVAGLYAQSAAPVLEERITAGENRLAETLARLKVKYVPLAHSRYPDEAVANVNTPEEYAALERYLATAPNGRFSDDRTAKDDQGSSAMGPGPSALAPVVAVCGLKKSGKTALLTELVPLLRARGLRVGVVKHDGHDFVPDVPGTDSFRLREAGADPVAVYSPRRFLLAGSGSEEKLPALLAAMRECDLVLMEGGKSFDGPKIEIVRAGSAPASRAGFLLALVAEADTRLSGVPRVEPGDAEGLSHIILEYLKGSPGGHPGGPPEEFTERS